MNAADCKCIVLDSTGHFPEEDCHVKPCPLHAAAPRMLEALKRSAPWLGKMIADGGHREAVLPRDCENTLDLIEALISEVENGR